MNRLRIGLFGYGTLARRLASRLAAANDSPGEIERIVVRRSTGDAERIGPRFALDPLAILDDDTLDTVVELIDNPDAALSIARSALRRGKNLVTANRAMLDAHRSELESLARRSGATLAAAACCSEAPFDTAPSRSLAKATLTAIDLAVSDRLDIPEEATAPDADDIVGVAARAELSRCVQESFGVTIDPERIPLCDARTIGWRDLDRARRRGQILRLVASASLVDGRVGTIVAPRFLPGDHPIAKAETGAHLLRSSSDALDAPTANDAILGDPIDALVADLDRIREASRAPESIDGTDSLVVEIYARSRRASTLEALPFEELRSMRRQGAGGTAIGTIRLDRLRDAALCDVETFFARTEKDELAAIEATRTPSLVTAGLAAEAVR